MMRFKALFIDDAQLTLNSVLRAGNDGTGYNVVLEGGIEYSIPMRNVKYVRYEEMEDKDA